MLLTFHSYNKWWCQCSKKQSCIHTTSLSQRWDPLSLYLQLLSWLIFQQGDSAITTIEYLVAIYENEWMNFNNQLIAKKLWAGTPTELMNAFLRGSRELNKELIERIQIWASLHGQTVIRFNLIRLSFLYDQLVMLITNHTHIQNCKRSDQSPSSTVLPRSYGNSRVILQFAGCQRRELLRYHPISSIVHH